MDQKIFDELLNNQVVTVVGLNAADYKDLDDLKNKGFATSIAADDIYEKLNLDEAAKDTTEIETEE